MVHLITGYAGKPHVTSASDGAMNAGMYGTGKYILNIGEKFGYEIISNNLIKIKSGYAINQGRKIEIAINDYEEITIDNGLQGMKRCDLVVLRYEKNQNSGIESASLVVIKGTSGDTYVEPEHIEGDILAGEGVDDIPLYKVMVNSLSIESVETMFTVTNSIMDIIEGHEGTLRELNTDLKNGAVSSLLRENLAANQLLVSNTSGKVQVSGVTSVEAGYLSGIKSNIQSQINSLETNKLDRAESVDSALKLSAK